MDLNDENDYYLLLYNINEKNQNKYWEEFEKELSNIEIS